MIDFIKSLNPWVVVDWHYCEIKEHGVRVLRYEGTAYLWKAWITGVVVCIANFLLSIIIPDHPKSDFFITKHL